MVLARLYSIILLCSCSIATGLAVLSWRRRGNRVARVLFWVECAVAVWAGAIALEALSSSIPAKRLWSQIAYLGTTTAPVLFLLLVVSFCFRGFRVSRRLLLVLMAFPAATCIGALLNPLHGWIWPRISVHPETGLGIYAHGLWWWVLVAHSYLYLVGGMFVLVLGFFRLPASYRVRLAALLCSSLFPFACNLVYVFDLNPVPGLDWTLVGFIISGVILGWAILRMDLLTIVPLARHAVFEQMSDGALVLDLEGRFLDCNNAFCRMTGLARMPAPGTSISDALGRLGVAVEELLVGGSVAVDSRADASGADYHVHVNPLTSIEGDSAVLVTVHDTTDLHHLRAERDKLRAEIRAAQSEIRKLSGLLPICAQCKRIRNDQGYWQRVESYIHTHTNVTFTHGLCPACMRNQLGATLSEELDPEFGMDRMLD